MDIFCIRGGTPLHGRIALHGAKNAALPLLAATLATGARCELHDCPDISDVTAACAILRHLGCAVEQHGGIVAVDAGSACRSDIPAELMRKMRAAVLFLGPLLARFGTAELSLPGGCVLGARPIDLHLRGLRRMGAEITLDGEHISARTDGLHGCTVALPLPSVGATENLILAALGCRGTLTLCNAAREPEIGDLIVFLRACGADIRGEGSLLRIRGGVPLTGARHTVLPDRMEAATYLAAAAATRGDVTLTNVRPEHLTAVLAVLERAGCTLTQQNGMLRLRCSRPAGGGADPPPRRMTAFRRMRQAPLMAAMAVAEGVTVFEENLFEDRFRHVPALRALGAHIHAARRYAVVTGVRELHGASMTATDLRGGAAMVIGALCARGESELAGTAHLKRGYAELVPTLRAWRADITER